MSRALTGGRRSATGGHSREGGGEEGFTLIEMVVALLVCAVVFMALAGVLISTLKVVGINKTRAQANEYATRGMEDLQRFDYAHLGLCQTASDAPPSNLGGLSPVMLTNCSDPTYEDPCHATTTTLTTAPVPAATYTCTKDDVSYKVDRYIVWADATETQKSLAVVVSWTDQAGNHQVTEQSALRVPSQPNAPGSTPPSFSTSSPPTVVNASGSTNSTVDSSGQLASPLTVTATARGLSSSDVVVANFLALQNGTPTPQELSLTSTDGTTWTGTIPASSSQYEFPTGSQYFTITAIRQSDDESNSSIVVPPNTFCPSGGCTSSTLPAISSTSVPSSPVSTDSAGYLTQDLTVSASTTDVTIYDTVSVTFETVTGAASITLQPGSACDPQGDPCTWSATISTTSSYRFPTGSQPLYFTAAQQSGNPCASSTTTSTTSTTSCPTDNVDNGSTTAAASSPVTFQ
jgi:prepilin-type N-terminal cleavage/methylation domain-containing protein